MGPCQETDLTRTTLRDVGAAGKERRHSRMPRSRIRLFSRELSADMTVAADEERFGHAGCPK